MAGGDVHVGALRALLRALDGRDGAPAAVLEGLGLQGVDLSDPQGRLPWDAYSLAVDRAGAAWGGARALEADGALADGCLPGLEAVALTVTGVQALYAQVLERVLRKVLPPLGIRAEKIRPDTITVNLAIPEGKRACPGVFHVVAGLCRRLPRLLGMADAGTASRVTDRHARVVVTFPQGVPRPPPPHDAVLAPGDSGLPFNDAELAARAATLGLELTACTGLRRVFDAYRRWAVDCYLTRTTGLWIHRPNGCLEPVADDPAPRPVARVSRVLACGGAPVGRLEIDLPVLGLGGDAPLFEATLPWLGSALARAGQARDQVTPTRGHDWLARAVEEWALTPRQAEVFARVAQGASNKEIARDLHTSVRTVEVHVGEILRRAHADSRTTLLARAANSPEAPRRDPR
jgi:DNA-binding CsgD family transcriptional regulator